jgi:acetylornithine deacetylase/succinyl-diaminopimelate desuccinylase-like protein
MDRAARPLEYVTASADRFVEEWRAACRLQSIKGHGDLHEMAEWVAERSRSVFDTVELVPTPNGPPAVLGTLEGRGPGRLLLYSHYDVQPPGPLAEWSVDPFGGTLRDGSVIARGCCDDKADLTGRLQALEAWQATEGALPFSVVWLCEGAEETGSHGLGEVIAARRALLGSCDWCLWESYLRAEDGRPEIGFGCRGLLYVELSLRRLTSDQHSAFATIYRSAAADLVRALASLVDERGVVAIDGFHAAIAPVTALETSALARIEPPASEIGVRGRSGFVTADRRELARRLLFEPTANIAGMWAGHTVPGAKTVLPAEARAKIDFRLVPDQTPEAVLGLLRAHLDRHGFEEIEIDVLSSVPPARSPLDSVLAEAVIASATTTFGAPVLYPFVTGSGPVHHVSNDLGIPTVMPPGATRLTSRIHGPDENASVEDYLELIRFTVRLFDRLEAARVR